jgi:hypothetical protein
MPLLNKIKIYSGRVAQGKRPIGNNQQGRASDINPIIEWVNQRSDVNTTANAVTTSAFAANAATATLNAISGTITSTTLTVTAALKQTITVTNSYCTANSTVLAVITDANVGTGAVYIASVVPSTGSFVITLVNGVVLTGIPTVKIKFIIL